MVSEILRGYSFFGGFVGKEATEKGDGFGDVFGSDIGIQSCIPPLATNELEFRVWGFGLSGFRNRNGCVLPAILLAESCPTWLIESPEP